MSRIKTRGGSYVSGSTAANTLSNLAINQPNAPKPSQPKLNKTHSLSPRRLIPPDIGTTAEAHSGVLQQLPIPSLKILNLLCTWTTQRMRGDFLIFLRRVDYCTCNLYWVYKGFGYHSQYTTPIHQYTSPAAILQPHNMVFNLQKP